MLPPFVLLTVARALEVGGAPRHDREHPHAAGVAALFAGLEAEVLQRVGCYKGWGVIGVECCKEEGGAKRRVLRRGGCYKGGVRKAAQ